MRLGIAIGSLLLVASSAQATDAGTQQLIQQLQARIEQLEKRVADLEANTNPAPIPVLANNQTNPHLTAVPVKNGAPHSLNQTPPQPLPESGRGITQPSLKIAGFTDLDFSATDARSPAVTGFGPQTLLATHSGFQEGQFVLHLSSALSPKVNVFGELSLTARADAGRGNPPAAGFNAEVERAIIRFEQNDYFKISFGRYHTPINYWNTAFHHGQWLQTTISRPEMVQFGGSFIPVHFVGSLVEGALPAGGLNLNYNLGLGNGRGAVISRGGDFGDINNNRAWLATLFVKPDHPYGLQIGGSVYRDKLDPFNAAPAREWIQSGHIVWQKETPEFIAEFANVTHQSIGGSMASHSQAFYVQAGYRLPWRQKLWKPYYRFEYIHIPRVDEIFRTVPGFHASTAGVRYDIANFAALKLEYRHYRRPAAQTVNGVFMQTAFTF